MFDVPSGLADRHERPAVFGGSAGQARTRDVEHGGKAAASQHQAVVAGY